MKGIFPKAFGNFAGLDDSIAEAALLARGVIFPTAKGAKTVQRLLNQHIRDGMEVDPDEWENPALIRLWLAVKQIKEDALF